MDKPISPAPPDAIAVKTKLPEGAVNAHVHLVGDDFTLWENAVERPAPGSLDAWLERFRAHQAQLGCTDAVMVHSILYGGDNSITLEAARRYKPGTPAVVLIRDDATEAEIAALAEAGAKAVRLNYVHGGLLSWEGMVRLAPVLAAYNLHVEMLAHSHLHLEELAPQVPQLPVDIVFDHCAWPDPTLGQTAGEDALVRLLGEGHAWCKLSATYRFDLTPKRLLSRLVQTNPEQVVWGSDWPHLMLGGAKMPDIAADLEEFQTTLASSHTHLIFVDNPRRLYALSPCGKG